MRCSRCGKKGAEVVAVARPRPRGHTAKWRAQFARRRCKGVTLPKTCPAEARRFQAPDLRYLAAYLEMLIVLTTLVTPETWRATSFALSPTCPWVTIPVK